MAKITDKLAILLKKISTMDVKFSSECNKNFENKSKYKIHKLILLI